MKSAAQPFANRSQGRGPFLHEAENVGSCLSDPKLDYRLSDTETWRVGHTECLLGAYLFFIIDLI